MGNKMNKEIEITFLGDAYKVWLELDCYVHGRHLYVSAWSDTDGYPEPFSDITVNFANEYQDYLEDKSEDMWFAYIDEQFNKWVDILSKKRIVTKTPYTYRSGFNVYRSVLFNEKKLREYCGDEAVDRYIKAYEETHN